MKIDLKLTQRDKKLLSILGVIVLVAILGGLVIFPTLRKTNQLKLEIIDAQIEQEEKKIKLETFDTLVNQIDLSKNLYQQEKAKYFNMMTSTQIDQYLIDLAVRKGLIISDLDISLPNPGQYVYIGDYDQLVMGNAKEAYSEYQGLYQAKIKMNINGNINDIWAMIDTICHSNPKILIDQMDFYDGRLEDGIQMTLYMFMSQDIE